MLRNLLDVLHDCPAHGRSIESITFTSQENSPWYARRKGSNCNQLSVGAVHSDVPWPYMILVELAPYLTNLKMLCMSGHAIIFGHGQPLSIFNIALGYDPRRTPAKFMDAILMQRGTLQSMQLSIVQFATLQQFTSFILSLPGLRALQLADVDIQEYDYVEAAAIVNSTENLPPLNNVILSMAGSDAGTGMCGWFLHTGLATRISALQIKALDCSPPSQYANAVGSLIRACGSSLRDLRLEISEALSLGQDRIFSFALNSSLRHLTIKQWYLGEKEAQRTKRLDWLVGLLSTIPDNNQLQTLNISVNMPYNPHGTKDASLKSRSKLASDFAQLDALLAGDLFKLVRRIMYEVNVVNWRWKVDRRRKDCQTSSGEAVSTSKLFPLSEARGVFQFKSSFVVRRSIYTTDMQV